MNEATQRMQVGEARIVQPRLGRPSPKTCNGVQKKGCDYENTQAGKRTPSDEGRKACAPQQNGTGNAQGARRKDGPRASTERAARLVVKEKPSQMEESQTKNRREKQQENAIHGAERCKRGAGKG
jgi:hypothetical protein